MIVLRFFTIPLRLSNRNTASLKTLGRYSTNNSFSQNRGGKDGGKESAKLAALREYEKSLSTFDRIPTEDEMEEPLLDQYDLPLTDADDLAFKNESQRTDDVAYVEFMGKNDSLPKNQSDLLSENARQRTDDVTYVEFMKNAEENKSDR